MLNANNSALLVVDPQVDFCSPEGVLARKGFNLSDIEVALRNLEHWLYYSVCPFLTAIDAYYLGYKLILVEDCLGTYEGQAYSLEYWRKQCAARVVKSTELGRV